MVSSSRSASARYLRSTDVIAVIKDVGEMGEIVSKATQRTVQKRELNLVDRSGFSCRLTLWGKQAQDFSGGKDSIVAFKGVKVGDFGGLLLTKFCLPLLTCYVGRSLSAQSSSTMMIDPDVPDAHVLRGW